MCVSLVTEHLIHTTGADILAGKGGSHDDGVAEEDDVGEDVGEVVEISPEL